MVYTPYDPHSVTMESVGAVQDTNVPHKADIVAAADGIEEGLEEKSRVEFPLVITICSLDSSIPIWA